MSSSPARKRPKVRASSSSTSASAGPGVSENGVSIQDSSTSKAGGVSLGSSQDALRREIAAKLAAMAPNEKSSGAESIKVLKWKDSEWNAWKEAPTVTPIEGTSLMVLKTPLSAIYESDLGQKEEEMFTMDSFCSDQSSSGTLCSVLFDAIPDSADYLYNRLELFDDWDVERFPIPIDPDQAQGLDLEVVRFVPPSRAQVAKFLHKIRVTLVEDPHTTIGVMSTFGLNRAGVLVVSYLVEVKKLSLVDALALFNRCRPPGIYSKSCVLALQRRYGPKVALEVPAAPAWDKLALEKGAAKPKSYTLPPLSTPGTAAPSGAGGKAKPPAPWQRGFSKRENREFFFNPETKKSVWSIEDCK